MKGLALSGGGYRATLFALGSLWRLNDAGILKSLDTITCVSGGAITAGFLAYQWDKLSFSGDNETPYEKADNFEAVVANPLIAFCGNMIDIPSAIKGLITPGKCVGDFLIEKYDSLLFNGASLSHIDDKAPEFIFYGTNYDTGVSVRITKDYFRDYMLGTATNHNLSLAQAVCISSCFPPFFAPYVLDGSNWKWEKSDEYNHLFESQELKKSIVLCDGGLYDNLALEKLWKTNNQIYDTVFVADAGAPLAVPYSYSDSIIGKIQRFLNWRNMWSSQFMRMTDIMINQQRALRKRWLINNYLAKDRDGKPLYYNGKYWGIDVEIEKYGIEDALMSTNACTKKLSALPTQLRPFNKLDVNCLVNWGYATADAALRSMYPVLEKGKLPF